MSKETNNNFLSKIGSWIFMILAAVLVSFSIFEVYYSDKIFSFVELLINKFPGIWEYQYHIALGEVALAAIFIILAFVSSRPVATKLFETFSRIGLGGMFIAASIYKISNPLEFAMVIAQYQLLPQFAINLFALILPMTELFVGTALIFTKYTRENSIVISLMFISFMIALANALHLDLGIVCGCFSFEEAPSKSEAKISIIRDSILMIPTIFIMLRPNKALWNIWKK